jgi:hypothetical protein
VVCFRITEADSFASPTPTIRDEAAAVNRIRSFNQVMKTLIDMIKEGIDRFQENATAISKKRTNRRGEGISRGR